MQITFNNDGSTATCLYGEEIDLRELGSLTMERASTIEWDAERQAWIVRLPDGTEIFSHYSREVCLLWEHENLS